MMHSYNHEDHTDLFLSEEVKVINTINNMYCVTVLHDIFYSIQERV